MFVDRVTLKFQAGKGGNGIVSWRREKYMPKGGPAGGNGGLGGSVYLIADRQVPSLEAYRHKRIIKADNGAEGGRASRQGRSGKDLILKVPCGTQVKDLQTGEVLFDLTEDQQKILLCKGGKGGFGNEHFKTPTHQAPNICTLGKIGEEKQIELELKLIADVGLVGFPNAGKSTFLSTACNVPVKIAPYPFTTLRPNLGYLPINQQERILLADIPGIIKGAHVNRGLGLEFLRHIERTKLLLYVLDAAGIDGRNPIEDFYVLQNELKAYGPHLLKRPYLVLLNKMDCEEAKEWLALFNEQVAIDPSLIFPISAATGEGLQAVKEILALHGHEKLEQMCEQAP